MKKNYNFNYVNRQATKKAAIEYSSVEVATCTSKVLAKAPVEDGKLWHTTDSDEFYYDWNGKRTKLNLKGGSSSSNVDEEINKIKKDLAKLNPAKMDQLESKVNNAVSKVNNITSTVNSAVADAQAATQAANEAAAAVNDKVSQSELQEAINNISLTPGEKGEKGDKGDQGEKGEKGDKGDQGLPGADGAKGDKGDQGEKGEKGDQGEKGEKGDKGDQGLPGADGAKGDKGDQGEKGDKGDKGDQGEKGEKGDQGLPGADGAKGDKGDQGEKGEKGDQGEKGDKGDKGDQGLPGADGAKGDKGDQGDQGEKGDKGDKGEQGLPGADGADGIDGIDGVDGKSAYELYKDSVSVDKEFLIVDHTNFADARNNELADYYNNYPTEASQDGESWPPFTASAFPWVVVNHAFDGNTVLKLFYKGSEVLSYTPSAEVEKEDGSNVARTYAIIGVPSLGETFEEFAETNDGTDNLIDPSDFTVKLTSASDDLTLEQWLASLKGEKGEPGDGTDVEVPTMVSAFTNDAGYTTKSEVTDRLGIIGSDEESNQYEYIYDEASWNASYADGVLKEYYEANPSEDLWNEAENRPVNFNDKVYTAKVYLDAAGEGEYETKQFAAYWLSEEVQRLTEVGSENVYYIPMFYDVPNTVFEMFCNAPGGAMAKAADLTDSSAHYIRIESADFTGAGVGHSWQAASDNNGARFPWIAVSFNGGVKKYIKFEYEGKDAVYPWGDKTFGTGDKTWGIASVAKEWEDNGFLIEKNKNNGDENWDGELGVDFGDFDINKFKMILVTPSSVKDYVDSSVSNITIPEVEEGTFPAGNNIENVNAAEDGFATVQDVMDYVRAYFEKKKDELEDSDSDVPVIPYVYITGYALNGEPTNITVFNQFELNESGNTEIEVIAPQEIAAWDPSTNDDLPSIKMTVDVPDGYTPTALYIWNVLTNEYQLLTGDNDFAQNPRYESRIINGVTYNSYVRGSADDVNTRGETRYKIIITK